MFVRIGNEFIGGHSNASLKLFIDDIKMYHYKER